MQITKRKLQNIGSVLILVAYILFILNRPFLAWFGCLTTVGIIELWLIIKYDTTITSYLRDMFHKRIDLVIMLSSIPLTWWLGGETAAGFFFIGLLLNHFTEKQ